MFSYRAEYAVLPSVNHLEYLLHRRFGSKEEAMTVGELIVLSIGSITIESMTDEVNEAIDEIDGALGEIDDEADEL